MCPMACLIWDTGYHFHCNNLLLILSPQPVVSLVSPGLWIPSYIFQVHPFSPQETHTPSLAGHLITRLVVWDGPPYCLDVSTCWGRLIFSSRSLAVLFLGMCKFYIHSPHPPFSLMEGWTFLATDRYSGEALDRREGDSESTIWVPHSRNRAKLCIRCISHRMIVLNTFLHLLGKQMYFTPCHW